MTNESCDSSDNIYDTKKPILFKFHEFENSLKFFLIKNSKYFIFIKNKNQIQIIDLTNLTQVYSIFTNNLIQDFDLFKVSNSLVLCTTSNLEIYNLLYPNIKDNQIKINYSLHKSINLENTFHVSTSILNDMIITLNKHFTIDIFDVELKRKKSFQINLNNLSKEINILPLDVFMLNYDTKTILISKFGISNFGLIYKNNANNDEDQIDNNYKIKTISLNENIVCIREYLQNINMYFNYNNSSIFLILTEGLNFLIVEKVYEFDPNDNDIYNTNIPNIKTLLYINLLSYTECKDYKFLSFGIFNRKYEEILITKKMKSRFLNDDYRNTNKNDLRLDDPNCFLNYNEKNLKEIFYDYLIFNLNEKIIIFKLEGLSCPPFNNPLLNGFTLVKNNSSVNNNILLFAYESLDNNFSICFMDMYYNIHEYYIKKNTKDINDNEIFEEEIEKNEEEIPKEISNLNLNPSKQEKKYLLLNYSYIFFTIYQNIIYSEYNLYNQENFAYEYIDNNSLILIMNNQKKIEKIIIFENIEIKGINWIESTNFIITHYNKNNQKTNNNIPYIIILNIYSKHLTKKINILNEDEIKKKFIYINISLYFKLNVYIHSIFIDNKSIHKEKDTKNENNNFLSVIILLKTNFSLYLCNFKIYEIKNSIQEYKCVIIKNNAIKKGNLILSKKDKEKNEYWFNKKFVVIGSEFYYSKYDNELNIFSLMKINNKNTCTKIYETLALSEIYFEEIFYNNFFVYIDKNYINIYDISNRIFYRLDNAYYFCDYNKFKISLYLYEIYLYLIVLTYNKIQIFKIQTNNNNDKNEIVYSLKQNLILGDFSKINLLNNMITVNDSQIVNLLEIINNKNIVKFHQIFELLNYSFDSIFCKETFLNYFLSNNENINKVLLNLFYYKIKSLKLNLNNLKLIPNFLSNIEIVINLLFDGNYNKKNVNNNLNLLSFSKNTDSQKIKEIDNLINQSKQKFNINNNLLYCIKTSYDIFSDEKTKNSDFITKYFLLKFKIIFQTNTNFKFSTKDLCWISLVNDQTDLINFICKENINWELITKYNIPLWIHNKNKLQDLLTEIAKNKYNQDIILKIKNNKIEPNNFTENIALYLYLADKKNLLLNYYDKEPQNEKIKKFIMRDFSSKKNKKAAKENADELLNKKKYMYAAFFYLLADDIRSALDMIYDKMKDINLTVCMLKLLNKNLNEDWKKYYSIEKIYTELFINFGIIFRDPYLVTFGYLGQEKFDNALEYLLNYNNEYNLDKYKNIFQDVNDCLEIFGLLNKSFSFSVFDYKILFLVKQIEKIYNIKFEESNKIVQGIANTDFNENDWDLDDMNENEEKEENDTKKIKNNSNQTIIKGYKLKKINVNYGNLLDLALKNELGQGILFNSILSLYKKNNKFDSKNLSINLKNNLICIISNRIILDCLYCSQLKNIDSNKIKTSLFFNAIDSILSEYLVKGGIIKQKNELYEKINNTFLLLNEYNNIGYFSIKLNKIVDLLMSIQKYLQNLMEKNIKDLLYFNLCGKINISELGEILLKFYEILYCIIDLEEPKIIKNSNTNIIYNLIVFKILFSVIFYLIFAEKIVLKYNKISQLYEMSQKLIIEYNNISQFNKEKIIQFSKNLLQIITKLIEKIKNMRNGSKKIYLDDGIICFSYFLCYAINYEFSNFFRKNQKLYKFTINNFSEEFTFLKLLYSLIELNINNFDMCLNNYINNHLDCVLAFNIHEELKNIYINKNNISFIPDDKSNYKCIKFEKIFNTKQKNKFFAKFIKFEKLFKLSQIIPKYIFIFSDKFKYDIKRSNTKNTENNLFDISKPASNYSNKSIQIINSLFISGYEIIKYNEDTLIKNFCFNKCNINQISLSLLEKGNVKINLLNHLLQKERINNFYDLKYNTELNGWEEAYQKSCTYNYQNLFNQEYFLNNKRKKYENILSIIYQNLIWNNDNNLFEKKLKLPPKYFNDIYSYKYSEIISLYSPINNFKDDQNDQENENIIYSDALVSHPQLPLYLSSNKKGIIFLYSYDNNIYNISKKIDEYYINKIENNDLKYTKNINKIKFNSYGDNFMANDKEGNLFLWEFNHIQSRKIPKNIINNEKYNNFYCDDMCFLNNTGVIATTTNYKKHNSYLFDLLMPNKKQLINNTNIGGNFILSLNSSANLLIANDKPGCISFMDIRKMEVHKEFFVNNNKNKIIDMKISENENFLVTYESDYKVKIWDLSDKMDPLLIEDINVFNDKFDINGNTFKKKSFGKMELINGFLFASKDNSLKLIRNKII